MATKKYLSLDRLTEYDALIKQNINSGDAATLKSAKDYVDGLVVGGHNHDDRYYTETEIDGKLSTINTSISNITNGDTTVKKAEHATKADTATSATTADSATKATQDGNGKNIASTYETKTDASAKLEEAKGYTDDRLEETEEGFYNIVTIMYGSDISEAPPSIREIASDEAGDALESAKTYADSAALKVKNDLLNGAGTAYDTLKELGDLIDDNADAIEALETIASGKADATHYHAISEVNGLQDALDGKAASSHGTHVTYSTTAPVMDGTASAGTATTVARSDHKHPTDTSRASQADLDALQSVVDGKAPTGHGHDVATTSAAGFMSADMVTKLNGIAEGANKTIIDSALSTTSTNPVQNKVVNDAITTATSAITANTNSIATHTTQISALQTAVG